MGSSALEPLRLHLDLDPAQLHGPLPVPHDDDGVVERDLGCVDPADPQDEGPPARPDLEHLAQGMGADDGPEAPPDRAVGAETAHPVGGMTSVTSSRWRKPLPAAGRVSLRVTSSLRPRRRVRTTKPARAIRQSAVSR